MCNLLSIQFFQWLQETKMMTFISLQKGGPTFMNEVELLVLCVKLKIYSFENIVVETWAGVTCKCMRLWNYTSLLSRHLVCMCLWWLRWGRGVFLLIYLFIFSWDFFYSLCFIFFNFWLLFFFLGLGVGVWLLVLEFCTPVFSWGMLSFTTAWQKISLLEGIKSQNMRNLGYSEDAIPI